MEDVNQTWVFPDNHFDYIHARWLLGCVTDWDAVFARAYQHLKPGGWLESYETSAVVRSDDGSVREESACEFFLFISFLSLWLLLCCCCLGVRDRGLTFRAVGQWGKIFAEGGRRMGVSFGVIEEELQRRGMERAGFVEVEERDIKVSFLFLCQRREEGMLTRADADWGVAERGQGKGVGRVYTGGAGEGRRGLYPVYDECAGVDEGADFGVHEEVDQGDWVEEEEALL